MLPSTARSSPYASASALPPKGKGQKDQGRQAVTFGVEPEAPPAWFNLSSLAEALRPMIQEAVADGIGALSQRMDTVETKVQKLELMEPA
jgi:hypothetical protein